MFIHRLEVRFRDCDAMGHVNNAVYLTYLEQTRFAHWRSLWGVGNPQLPARGRSGAPGPPRATEPGCGAEPHVREDVPGVILARIECDYKRSPRYGDALEIRMRVAEIGRTSFKYEYEIVDAEGRTVLLARSVQVMYDYKADKSVPVPDNIRALLAGGNGDRPPQR